MTYFEVGEQLARMSDEDILALFNATITVRDRLPSEHPYVAIEIPPGQPQIRYYPDVDQWVPRGGVVKCLIDSDEEGQVIIDVDGRELSLEEFGKMLVTYAGWGMRFEFTPEDATDRRPRLEVRDPDEPS